MADDNTIHLAITMAGAISAGAYTAGVLDYLFEALDNWEAMKDDPEFRDIVPQHNVVIDVMSGASAGGMTACIASLAVQRDRYPITTFRHRGDSYNASVSQAEITDRKGKDGRKGKNRFYDSWVNLLDPDMMPRMLSSDDITIVTFMDEPGFISGLNSKFIDDVANRTLQIDHPEIPLQFPEYVSPKLKTFVTLANLDGFKRETPFAAGADGGFFTYDHRDVALFSFDGDANASERGIATVDLKDRKNANTRLFVECAIATGAFPIGLAYRTIARHRDLIEKNILLKWLHGNTPVKLDTDDVGRGGRYTATLVDGGTLDNEPFGLSRMLLSDEVGDTFASSEFATFNSTVLMIDPFPSEDRPPLQIEPGSKPLSVLGAAAALFSTVRGQSMLKPDEVLKAISRDNCSRFLISPKRKEEQKPAVNGSRAIACGSLGGFGGFIDKNFRRHDFYLGRINCKSFLQRHFVVPAESAEVNPVFASSYHAAEANGERRRRFGTVVPGPAGERVAYPIIPDVNKLKDRIDVGDLYFDLKFPKLKRTDFEEKFTVYDPLIKRRLRSVTQSYLKNNSVVSMYVGLGLRFGGSRFLKGIQDGVAQNLAEWKLL